MRLSPEDTTELLEAVRVSADRLTGLVDNLLDSSRLATGAVAPLLGPVPSHPGHLPARPGTGLPLPILTGRGRRDPPPRTRLHSWHRDCALG
ncbi:hypothetical protein [Saccharothrix texasensis]|uniref:hypothetical protein n=1 Tax=Saccharothrix texasensis TaxID=103734 RepID=UPI003CCC5858